jgi:hypothetical protein
MELPLSAGFEVGIMDYASTLKKLLMSKKVDKGFEKEKLMTYFSL